MAYTKLSKQTVDIMNKSLDDLKKMIDTMKKDKKADKKKIAELEKEFATKSANLAKKYNEDMKIAKTGFTQSSLLIEDRLNQSVKFLITGKDAFKTYQTTHQDNMLALVDGAPTNIQRMITEATQDMNDFGGSWNEYRELNASCDPKLIAEGNAIRTQIIETNKSLRTKIEKMNATHAEAVALKKFADEARSKTPKSNGEKLKEVQDLVKALMEMDKKLRVGKQTVETMPNDVNQFKTNAAAPIAALKGGMVKVMEGKYTTSAASVQGYVSNVTAMRKVLVSGKSTVGPEFQKDSSIAAVLRQADGIVTTAEGDVEKSKKSLLEMATELKKAQARVKAGK